MKKQHAFALASLAFCTAAAAQPYGLVSTDGSRLNLECEGAASCDQSLDAR